MCIIIVKKLGVKYPSIENVKNACDNNPDGFAIAWATDRVVRNYRTMNQKEFLKKCKEVFKNDYKTTAVVIHARIATHGSKKLENCHCWIDKGTALSFAHNGILSISNRGDMTDSETFFQDIFLPIYKKYGWSQAELAINACIGTSKFAFLSATGDIRAYGNYNELQGVMYSNTSYLARTWESGSFSWKSDLSHFTPSVWNPVTKTLTYRTDETDAEWEDLKQKINDLSFYDYAEGKYRIRGNETDDEWELLQLASEYALEEKRKTFRNTGYWE